MKNLINKDTIKEVTEMYHSPNVVFNEFKIPAGFSIRFGNVVVRKYGNTGILEMDDNVNKELFAAWKKDVGRLMSRDFNKGIFTGYYEIKANNKKALLRKIEYKDLVDFKESGFNHLYIGDYWYTILRMIPLNGAYNDPDEHAEADSTMYDFSCISTYDETDANTQSYDDEQQSFALFDDPKEYVADNDRDDLNMFTETEEEDE
jgi:hypothetical protein